MLECGLQLQLQLLGGGGAASGIRDDASISGSGGGGAVRISSLLDVSIESSCGLTDDELVAAAGALPGLSQLKVIAAPASCHRLRGPGLAALSACRRLSDLGLNRYTQLEGRELAAQLPGIGSLQTLQLTGSASMDRVDDNSIRELQAAFQAKHGRQLPVLNSQHLSGNESPIF